MDCERIKLMELWATVRWFLVVVLFSIGLLHISFRETMVQSLLFFAVFVGMIALNLMFQFQGPRPKVWALAFQIVLDIVFATFIVHITGGLSSIFVWTYLIGIITAALTTPQNGGVIAGLIGSLALLGLILLYNNGILLPTEGVDMDISGSMVYLLSYSGLFSGIALMANYLSDRINVQKEQQQNLEIELESLRHLAAGEQEMNNLRSQLKDIAHLDHDINTPLCVVTLSLGRVKRYANELGISGLQKTHDEITEAVNKISLLLQRLQPLKINPLVHYAVPDAEASLTQRHVNSGITDLADVITPFTTGQKIDKEIQEPCQNKGKET